MPPPVWFVFCVAVDLDRRSKIEKFSFLVDITCTVFLCITFNNSENKFETKTETSSFFKALTKGAAMQASTMTFSHCDLCCSNS